jgi:serine protease inhibitor
VWPLLGYLAAGADAPARTTFAEVLGVAADDADRSATRLLEVLDDIPEVRAALGLWAQRTVPLHQEWVSRLPTEAVGVLTGQETTDAEVLDDWVRQNTDGLIDRMPLAPDPRTLIVLATALAVRTRWAQSFTEFGWLMKTGPWASTNRRLGLQTWISELDRVHVVPTEAGPITVLRVPGAENVDVHLFLGEQERSAAQILSTGLGVLAGADGLNVPGVVGGELSLGSPGPGLKVREEDSAIPTPLLSVRVPGFTVSADHDLLDQADLYGLDTVTDPSQGHFPGISEVPLVVSQARQSATATFSAVGFEAAAVTTIGMATAAASRHCHRVRQMYLTVDRPFGFAAVHRDPGLVLVCGWVTEPSPYPDSPTGPIFG